MSTKKSSWKDSIQTFGRSLLLPIALLAPIGMVTVSYTHLDVYKRQVQGHEGGVGDPGLLTDPVHALIVQRA